jgi:hypothetical protein
MNKFLLTLALVALQINGICQQLPVHEKKVYVSPEGKIFYNKALPVYFYISTSSDPNAPRYLLKSESTPKYANPMYFDTEGKNTLRSPSAVDTLTKKQITPIIDVEYQIYIDSKAPSTRLTFEKSKTTIIKGVYHVANNLALSFLSTDEMSGVENVYVSINGKDYVPVKDSLVLDQEMEYTITYYAVDNTGNAEKLKEAKFYVDKTTPVSTLTIDGAQYNEILSGETKISISAKDSISGIKHIYYSIDDSVFKPYTGRISTAMLSPQAHKLFYFTIDQVNNKELVKTFNFYVDKTPPQVIEEVMGKTFVANGVEFSAGTSKLKITSFDNKAGVNSIYYSINNAAYVKYEKPVELSGYKGNLTIKSYAMDNVGNKSSNDLSKSRKNNLPYIDLSVPWVGHSFKGAEYAERDTVFISNQTRIILEAKDSESGIQKIEYQIDNNELIKYESPFTLNAEGYHSVSVFGYDNTDNLTRQEFGVMVDTTGPEIFERFSSVTLGSIELDGITYDQFPAQTVVFLSATDVKAGFESISYELNDKPQLPYMREIRGFIAGKKNIIRVKATDKLGNKTEKKIEFFAK